MPYNRVILQGNLTRDVELKYLPSGSAVCDIGLAVNERVKRNEEWVDQPLFCDCTAFGRTAELANQYLSKGSPALIEGKLRMDSWQDKEGNKRTKLKVVIDNLQFLGSKSDRQSQPESREAAAVGVGEESDPFDDSSIPF